MAEDKEGVVDALPDEVAFAAMTEEAKKLDETTPPETPPAEGEGAASTEGQETPPAPEGEDGADAETAGEGDQETRSQRRRRERREAQQQLERDAASLRTENATLRERLDKLEAPDAADFENPDDYTAAAAAHATRKANLEDRIADAGDAEKKVGEATQAVRADAFRDASAEARTRYADFDKVALGDHWKPTPVMMDVILDSDRSADLAYYLGGNPEEADRISRLPIRQQAVELGKIEALKLPDPKPKQKPQTQAPPPIQPVRPTAAAADKSPSEMTNDEYRAWRRRNDPKPAK